MKSKKLILGSVGLLIVGLLVGSYFMFFYSPYQFKGDGPIKIFYLNSYQDDFEWSNIAFKEFENEFEKHGFELNVKSVHMDTQIDRSQENFDNKKNEAVEIIEKWDPDLIYIQDDEAQEVVIQYINTNIPIVFSGMNYEPKKYGYDNAKNVAGVLERYDLKGVVEFVKTVSPSVKRIAVISDPFPQWAIVIEQLKKVAQEIDVEFTSWEIIDDYDDYKKRIVELEDEVDAILLLPPIAYVDENGNHIAMEEAIKTVIQLNKFPEISFWSPMVKDGILLSLDVSAIEQGKNAGIIAYKILIEGEKPSNFEFKHTTGGRKAINLARAKTLGIEQDDIPSITLINSEIFETFSWEAKNEK